MKIKTVFFLAIIVIVISLIHGILIAPYKIDISELYLEELISDNPLKGKTAVHLSDLHISQIGKREETVLKIIGEIEPDIIFLTGDFIRWKGDINEAIRFLSKLEAEMGIYAVMGDYDYSNSRNSCIFCHQEGTGEPTRQHKAVFLKNSGQTLNCFKKCISVFGIDENDDEDLYENVPEKNDFGIVLSHNPLNFEKFDEDKNILMLSGDTHGGQVPLPSWFWRLLGYRKNALFSHGLFQDGNKLMYVTRGIGTSHLPLRILRNPELVVLHF